MEDSYTTEKKFGDIELKLLKIKILNDVEKILEQVSNKDENFLYPVIDVNSPSERILVMNPLIKGEFMGHLYEICTNGAHPTAYVHCGVDSYADSYADRGNCRELPVHGGCSFSGNRPSADGIWVGWDYGHYGDYMEPLGAVGNSLINFGFAHPGKKWTASEVMQDVFKAIQYIEENK